MTDVRPALHFDLGRFALASGIELAQAELVYQTYGELNSHRNNAVLYPTSYGAWHSDIDWLIKPGGILDASRWFVVVPNMLGNGLSTSPSTLKASPKDLRFSHVDNVRAQDRLLREALDIEHLACVYGWSMGAQQAYHWAGLHPQRVAALIAICGTAKTSDHNRVFLLSLKAALQADPAWDGTTFTAVPDRGFRAFARIYASWAVSQEFYRQQPWRAWGYRDLEDYLDRGWEANYRRKDPRDLLAMLDTWLDNDLGLANPNWNGDHRRGLAAIRARSLIIAGSHDLYFPPPDCAADAAAISGAQYAVMTSIWGHRAGNPWQSPNDAATLQRLVHDFLAEREAGLRSTS